MAPYIAALILLIVVILLSIYKSSDSFTGYIVDNKMTFTSFIDTLSSVLTQSKRLKQTLDSAPKFDDEITRPLANFLGFDVIPREKPFSKALSTQLETDTILISGLIDIFEKAIKSGSIQPKQTLGDVAKTNAQVASIIKVLPRMVDVTTARETYIKSKIEAAARAVADTSPGSIPSTSSGGSIPSTSSGGSIASTVDMNDLLSAVKSSQVGDVDLTKRRITIDSVKEDAPVTSVASTKEMEDRIAKSVATQVKDSLLAQRSLQNGTEKSMGCPYANAFDSTATSQGQEYTQVKPDMSEYIRKDSIPCWNCSLP